MLPPPVACLILSLFTGLVLAHDNDGQKGFSDVNAHVTLAMLKKLGDDGSSANTFFSPTILTNSLTLLANGASGQSRQQILDFLQVENDGKPKKKVFDSSLKLLLSQINWLTSMLIRSTFSVSISDRANRQPAALPNKTPQFST